MRHLLPSISATRFSLRALALAACVCATAPAFAQEAPATLLGNAVANSMASANFAAASHAQAAREPQGLRAAANAGLQSLVREMTQSFAAGSLPEGLPLDITDLSELKSATLGLGFEVHSVQPKQLMAGTAPLDKMLQGNGIWNFLVMVGTHPVAMLEMAKVGGQWQMQSVGGAKLAQDVYQAAQTHGGKSAFRFVRIYQATSDLLEVQDTQNPQAKPRYVPLIAARETLRMNSLAAKDSVLPTGQDVMPLLQQAVRSNLADHANQ